MLSSKNTVQKVYIAWPRYIKFFILTIILYFLWIFNIPYITPLLMGFILAILTYPTFGYLNKNFSKLWLKIFKSQRTFPTLSAIITIIVVTYLVVLITQITTTQLVKEVPTLVKDTTSYLERFFNSSEIYSTADRIGITSEDVDKAKDQVLSKWGDIRKDLLNTENVSVLLNLGGYVFKMLFSQFLSLVVFFWAWYGALTSGKKWLKNLFKVLPFNESEIQTLNQKLKSGINNVLYASVVSSFVHATVTFTVMTAMGSPYVWIATILTFLVGIFPMSAAEFGYIIPVLTAFAINPFLGLTMIVVLELVVIGINYVLIPKMIASTGGVAPVLILTSIFSGVVIFGIMGFIIGPVIMVMVHTLWQIFAHREELEKNDPNSHLIEVKQNF